jgi:spore coat polysaccharide biosynthesis protein SpsF (cytidylyltransferase family)
MFLLNITSSINLFILNYTEASEHIEEEIYRLTDKTDKDGEKVTKNNEEPEQNTDEEMHVTKIRMFNNYNNKIVHD